MSPAYHALFQLGPDPTPYRKLSGEGVRVERALGRDMLVVERGALSALAEAAMVDINHLLRPGHLAQLAAILDDPEATANDKFVAYDLLKNANIAAGGVLPMCQDTGTAIVSAKKGRLVWTDGDDEAALAEGIRAAYVKKNLRYSQVAPLSMFEEKNTGDNLPAQIEIAAEGEDAYKFLFIAKGGGSANKSFLYQATPSILTHERMIAFLKEKILTLGTAACPPYHLAIVIGGTSAELTMKTVKLASARYLDALPTSGGAGRPRLPRPRDGGGDSQADRSSSASARSSAASISATTCASSACRATAPRCRSASASPARPTARRSARSPATASSSKSSSAIRRASCRAVDEASLGGPVVKIDLNRPMKAILAELTKHPIRTRLALTGTMIVARDLAHAKIRERLDRGEPMPDYLKNHPVYYAGPAKTPVGYASGSFGPTTAGPHGFLRRPVPGGGRLAGDARQGQPLARPCARPAPSTAASISARSAAPRRASPRTASKRSRCSNIPSSAWRRSGGSRSTTSPPSSSSTTRATTSSRS